MLVRTVLISAALLAGCAMPSQEIRRKHEIKNVAMYAQRICERSRNTMLTRIYLSGVFINSEDWVLSDLTEYLIEDIYTDGSCESLPPWKLGGHIDDYK